MRIGTHFPDFATSFTASALRHTPLSLVADELNPQPLPPGPPLEEFPAIRFRHSWSADELNPQPLPPGPPPELSLSNFLSADAVEINPQPLPPEPPPSDLASVRFHSSWAADDLNPQPLPPGPPENNFAVLANVANYRMFL